MIRLMPFRVTISNANDFAGPSPPDVPDWHDPTPPVKRVGITLDFDASKTRTDITKPKSQSILLNNAFLPAYIRVSTKPPFYDFVATGSRTTSESDIRFEPEYSTELQRLLLVESILKELIESLQNAVEDYLQRLREWQANRWQWEKDFLIREWQSGSKKIFTDNVTDFTIETTIPALTYKNSSTEQQATENPWYTGFVGKGVIDPSTKLRNGTADSIIPAKLHKLTDASKATEQRIEEIQYRINEQKATEQRIEEKKATEQRIEEIRRIDEQTEEHCLLGFQPVKRTQEECFNMAPEAAEELKESGRAEVIAEFCSILDLEKLNPSAWLFLWFGDLEKLRETLGSMRGNPTMVRFMNEFFDQNNKNSDEVIRI